MLLHNLNAHKLLKVKKMMDFLSSEKAKLLSMDEIIIYLKKFNLLTI